MAHKHNVTLRRDELREMLKAAAHDGAKVALAEIGLSDEMAGQDIRDIRSLIQAWRDAKGAIKQSLVQTATKLLVRWVVNFLFMLLMLGAAVKFGFKFGGG